MLAACFEKIVMQSFANRSFRRFLILFDLISSVLFERYGLAQVA